MEKAQSPLSLTAGPRTPEFSKMLRVQPARIWGIPPVGLVTYSVTPRAARPVWRGDRTCMHREVNISLILPPFRGIKCIQVRR